MSFDPRVIDESPLFKLLTEAVTKGPGWVLGKMADGLSAVGEMAESAGQSFSKVTGISLGASHSLPSSAEPAVTVARTREPEITKEATAVSANHFDPAELGCLSPSALPNCTARSSGISV